jgi:SOS-response transcriptional repressor LexA
MRSMPESQTIQRVLSCIPDVLPSRTYAKYFLIVIGDNMLKKTPLVHLINSVSKKLYTGTELLLQ